MQGPFEGFGLCFFRPQNPTILRQRSFGGQYLWNGKSQTAEIRPVSAIHRALRNALERSPLL